MYNRLNNHIIIANKLLDDIKIEYRETFSKLKTLSSKAYSNKYLLWKISDDEIGFLTLYFAKYFEETNFTKKAIVMCASGIGTSKLLYAKTHRNFPDLDLIGTISKNEYKKILLNMLILTSLFQPFLSFLKIMNRLFFPVLCSILRIKID